MLLSGNSLLELFTVLIIFIFVLVITYYSTKWIAGYQKGQMVNKNIEGLEAFRLSNNKYIQIIRIGDKYLAVAVCKDSVTVITELSKEQLNFSEDVTTVGGQSFKEFLQKAKDLRPKK